MTKDKTKSVPTPKTKALTKTQNELLKAKRTELEGSFQAIMTAVQNTFNAIGLPIIDDLVARFREELGLEEDKWVFDLQKNKFTETAKPDLPK